MQSNFRRLGQLNESLKEIMGSGHSDFERQHFQDQLFHSQNLFFSVSVIGNVNELAHFWRINFLVFPVNPFQWSNLNIRQGSNEDLRGNEHGGRADQLKFPAQNRHVR